MESLASDRFAEHSDVGIRARIHLVAGFFDARASPHSFTRGLYLNLTTEYNNLLHLSPRGISTRSEAFPIFHASMKSQIQKAARFSLGLSGGSASRFRRENCHVHEASPAVRQTLKRHVRAFFVRNSDAHYIHVKVKAARKTICLMHRKIQFRVSPRGKFEQTACETLNAALEISRNKNNGTRRTARLSF